MALGKVAAFHVVSITIGLAFAAIASWDPASGSNSFGFLAVYPSMDNYVAFWTLWFKKSKPEENVNKIFLAPYASEMLLLMLGSIAFMLLLAILAYLQVRFNVKGRLKEDGRLAQIEI